MHRGPTNARLAWAERLARNARPETSGRVTIILFGIPQAFATWSDCGVSEHDSATQKRATESATSFSCWSDGLRSAGERCRNPPTGGC